MLVKKELNNVNFQEPGQNGHGPHDLTSSAANKEHLRRFQIRLETLKNKLLQEGYLMQEISTLVKEVDQLPILTRDQRRQLFASRVSEIISQYVLYSPQSSFRISGSHHDAEMVRVGFASTFFTEQPESEDENYQQELQRGANFAKRARVAHRYMLHQLPRYIIDMPAELDGALEEYSQENDLWMNSREISEYLLEKGGRQAEAAAKHLFRLDMRDFSQKFPDIVGMINSKDLIERASAIADLITQSRRINYMPFPSGKRYLDLAREYVFNHPSSPFFLRRFFVRNDLPEEFLSAFESQLKLAEVVSPPTQRKITSVEQYAASALAQTAGGFLTKVVEQAVRKIQYKKTSILNRNGEKREAKIANLIGKATDCKGLFEDSADLLESWLVTAKTIRLARLDMTDALDKNGQVRQPQLNVKKKSESSRGDYQQLELFLDQFPTIAKMARISSSSLSDLADKVVGEIGVSDVKNSRGEINPYQLLSAVTEALFHSQSSPFRFANIAILGELPESFFESYLSMITTPVSEMSTINNLGWEKYLCSQIVRKIWQCSYLACWKFLKLYQQSERFIELRKHGDMEIYWQNVMIPYLEAELRTGKRLKVDFGKVQLMMQGLDIELRKNNTNLSSSNGTGKTQSTVYLAPAQ